MFYNESKLRICLILCSILSGWLFGIVYFKYQLTVHFFFQNSRPHPQFSPQALQFDALTLDSERRYDSWLAANHLRRKEISPEEKSFGPDRATLKTEAKFLQNRIRVHCLVLTRSREHSRTVAETWAKHCNSVSYYAKFDDSENALLTRLHLGDENIYSGRAFCKLFIDLLTKQYDFDWLLITMDGTFAIIDNLRFHIATLNASHAYYLGRPVKFSLQTLYNAYDSGIVLSRGAVNRLVPQTFASESHCLERFNQSELIPNSGFDSFLGYELNSLSVRPVYSLYRRASLFHPFSPDKLMNPAHIRTYDTFWVSNVYPVFTGMSACGDRAITFGGLSPVNVRFMYYLLYHVAVFKQQYSGLGNSVLSSEHKVHSNLDKRKVTNKN